MENLLYISENNLLQGNETNFITQKMLFNQANTWSVLSGSGTVGIINQNQFEGNGCLRIVPNIGVSITVSGTDTLQTITEEANYILSFKVKTVLSVTDSIYVRITVFINATPVDYEYFIDGIASPNVEDYKTLFLNLGTLPIGATLDFSLEVSATNYGALAKTYWDAFYLQKNTSGLGIPNVFTAPITTEINHTETIDIPSIASNSSELVNVTITGAKVGMFVNMTNPPAITVTDQLIIGNPVVSATNTVSFLVHNHSGSSVNPASGTFKFRVYE